MKISLIKIFLIALLALTMLDGWKSEPATAGLIRSELDNGWSNGVSAAMTYRFDPREIVIEGVRGFVVLNERYGENSFVRFLNEDGSEWHRTAFYYDDSEGRFPYEKDEFRPYAFHPDYSVFAVKLRSEDEDRYEVIVNEDTGLTKYLLKSDGIYEYQSWAEHIIELFAVEFDTARNPPRTEPGGKTTLFPEGGDEPTFHPVETSGEWLKVKWDSGKNEKPGPAAYEYGWVRWTESGKLLIELFYLC